MNTRMILSLIALSILMTGSVFASEGKECKVYGISDSPQRFDCFVDYQKNLLPVNLICRDGQYLIERNPGTKQVALDHVTSATHMDVVTGASPLVFRTNTLELTVTEAKNGFRGRLTWIETGKTAKGTCVEVFNL